MGKARKVTCIGYWNIDRCTQNMGDTFYHDLKPLFEKYDMQLLSLEIGDSPISVYCIGERLLLGDISNLVPEGAEEAYCRRVRKRYENLLTRKNP